MPTQRTEAASLTGSELKPLDAYLDRIGIGEYGGAFRARGITSLRLLRMIDSDDAKKLKAEICALIGEDSKEGAWKGSKLAAKVAEGITADDVQAWIDREQASETSASRAEPDAAAKEAKQQQLAQAIDRVGALREKWEATAAGANNEERAKAAASLDKLLGELRSEKGLETLPTAKEFGDDLDKFFQTTEIALARVSKLTAEAVSTAKVSAVDLIFGHQLLRGRFVNAHGTTEAPGGAVLAMPRRCTDADLFGPGLESQDFSRSYRSESAMMRAERLIDTHASSHSVASEASGAAFMGTGIGAMSLSARYAQAKEERADIASQSSARSAVQIQTRYHWSPTRQIVFATNELQLSSEALVAVRRLLGMENATKAQQAGALEFMRTFGSHVFGRITMGGWYRYTGKATADANTDRGKMEKAVATAMDWAVSASASYAGLGGASKATVAATDTIHQARVSGNEYRLTFENQEVTVSTTMLGGVDGLPREEWVGSLQYPSQWRVIQREAPVPIWAILRNIDPIKLGGPGKCSDLASMVEEVWVKRVFAPSLDRELQKAVAECKTALEVERILSKPSVSPPRLDWHLPDGDGPELHVLNPPIAFVYRNALHVCAPSLATDMTNWNNRGWAIRSFDGLHWWGAPDKYHYWGDAVRDYKALVTEQLWALSMNLAAIELQPSGDLLAFGTRSDKPEATAFTVDAYVFWTIRPKLVGDPALKLASVRPSLVRFKGNILLIYVDTEKNLQCTTILESLDAPVHAGLRVASSTTDHCVATAVFGEKVYCAYRDRESGKIHCTQSDDGEKWEPPLSLNFDANDGPSLAVFKGPTGVRLYCAFPDKGGDAPLYITSTGDGQDWDNTTKVGDVHCNSTPALVAFTDQSGSTGLYCFYMGSERDVKTQQQKLCYRVAKYS